MLTPDDVFAASNSIALVGWLALGLSAFLARIRPTVWISTGIAVPALFAVAYLGSLIAGLAGGASGGFGSIDEVRALFQNDHALTAGWIHYLAFDLIVGTLIARDAARAGTPAILVPPTLALTFLFGPVGLLTYVIIRIGQGGRLQESLS
ncbi:ABA4-like family protein [Chenggangzhangella methanolivorans]|uniref:DUF4281 domain-containing protein n=1 Tax=Chenggangzhangella methanolivorans TaxID=1437009 RepID=A0A9E6R6K1_9HYPH|nr:ABA4-like family protein [Chenggangzhangella methanolivorans]QZN99167.1 DUF4281 domain-containing protein [Chenggangzhangella methanolivorans]